MTHVWKFWNIESHCKGIYEKMDKTFNILNNGVFIKIQLK